MQAIGTPNPPTSPAPAVENCTTMNYLILMLKGCAMGMADVVPGVSGGTIAFISGIYGKLLDSIRHFDLRALKLLGCMQLRDLWKHIDGGFLFPVLGGIAIAIFTLARVMIYLLNHHPIETWSFFFGLIIASALLVSREVTRWDWRSITSMVVGAGLAAWITVASPTQTPDTWWFILLSGAIAICAMILPGISGAFVLLLLGKYQFIMQAVSTFDVPILVIFAIGAAVGIISFSHLLSWLLKHWHDLTVALLMGFMIGSLNKIWPWKKVLETYTDSHGTAHPLVEANISPAGFEALTGRSAQLPEAILFCIVGLLLIGGIEFVARFMARKREA